MATAAILNITKKSRYLGNGLTDLYEIWYEDAKQQTFLRVLPTRWRQKTAGIDMDRNYVTVTLCIWQTAAILRIEKLLLLSISLTFRHCDGG